MNIIKDEKNIIINKLFNKYFIYYILSLSLFSIFYLYQKHTVGNDTSISEYLINYQGGFTRRGLTGEIFIQASYFFDLKLRFVIFFFQSLIYLIFLYLIYNFFKGFKKNIIFIFAILTPIFLLFPVAEIESLGRKETIYYVFFITLLNFKNPQKSNLFTLFILPVVCLIHEQIILFSGFIFTILMLQNKVNNFKNTDKVFVLFVPSIIIIIIFILFPQSVAEHKVMAETLLKDFNEACYMSCYYVVNNDINNISKMISVSWNISTKDLFIVIFRYLMIILIGFFPIFLASYYSSFRTNTLFYSLKIKNLLLLILILYIPVVPLFIFGGDWGRWVGMLISFTTLSYFYLYKNNLIKLNTQKLNKKLFFFKYKKKLLIFIFIIFAFGWNQKTTNIEDVATKPIYKIPYKTVKILFNIGSINLFKDSILNKFYENYLE